MPKQKIEIHSDALAQFCQRHLIRKLALFGFVLRDDFGHQSDIDVLVEFEPGNTPGFFRLYDAGGGAMKDYHINVFWSEEDWCYVADIPDLKACSAFGATPVEAMEEALKAKEAWLAVAQESGDPIPPPLYRPVIYQACH